MFKHEEETWYLFNLKQEPSAIYLFQFANIIFNMRRRHDIYLIQFQNNWECNNKKKVLLWKSTSGLMSQANAFLDKSDNIIKNEEGICSSKEIKPPINRLVEGGGKWSILTRIFYFSKLFKTFKTFFCSPSF